MKIIDIMEIMDDIQYDQLGDMEQFGAKEIMEYTKRSRYKFTAVTPEGVPVASFGVNDHKNDDNGTAWGVVSTKAGKWFLGVHRAVREFLDGSEFDIVYMTVRDSFDNGKRWAEMLGFEKDRSYMSEKLGEQAIIYRRLKNVIR